MQSQFFFQGDRQESNNQNKQAITVIVFVLLFLFSSCSYSLTAGISSLFLFVLS